MVVFTSNVAGNHNFYLLWIDGDGGGENCFSGGGKEEKSPSNRAEASTAPAIPEYKTHS